MAEADLTNPTVELCRRFIEEVLASHPPAASDGILAVKLTEAMCVGPPAGSGDRHISVRFSYGHRREGSGYCLVNTDGQRPSLIRGTVYLDGRTVRRSCNVYRDGSINVLSA